MSNNQEEELAMARFLPCRASLALNNMGVSLLERGCIREAINAFTDSIGLMKRSMESNHDAISCVDVEKCLRKNDVLLVQVNQRNPQGHHHPNILPLDDHDELSEAAFDHGPSSPCSFPIRLRCHNNPAAGCSALLQHQPQSPQQLEVPAAIILYNLGLANLLLACSSDQDIYGQKFGTRMLSCAFKSLSLSQCILTQQVDKRSCNNDIYPELKLKQLSALVLQCLFRVFHWTSQTHEADRVLATLTRLVHEGRESEGILQSLNVETGNHTMAPAA